MSDESRPPRRKDPLEGMTLEAILKQLIEHYGWETMGKAVPINCFLKDPSLNSSLKFLRRVPWARKKVEDLFLSYVLDQERSPKK